MRAGANVPEVPPFEPGPAIEAGGAAASNRHAIPCLAAWYAASAVAYFQLNSPVYVVQSLITGPGLSMNTCCAADTG